MIDLHTHSTFSDGSLTPEQLVARATETGLTAIALTDHDTTGGIGRFLDACRGTVVAGYRDGRGLTGVPGVEVSADVAKGTLHVLGYYVEPGHPELEAVLDRIRDGREDRNQQILRKLNALGLVLAWEEVAGFASEDVVGRPHFAQAMLARGYVSNKEEAFDRYLGKGKPAYVDRFRLTAEDSIAVIRRAGGVAVLSHPFTLDLKPEALAAFVGGLKDKGLQGIEVFYSEHSPELTAQYRALARRFDLVGTGGSDFHGALNPDIAMGRGFGNLCVPDEIVEGLQARRQAAV